jgi:hypothetical protein
MYRLCIAATLLLPGFLGAQELRSAATVRLSGSLGEETAARVQTLVHVARTRELPHEILELLALELAAKHVPSAIVVRRVEERLELLERSHAALQRGRTERPSHGETAGAAQVMERGVSPSAIEDLARSAPSGRSLSVPLLVLAELMDAGLPRDEAIARVRAGLSSRATDDELRRLVRSRERESAGPPGRVASGRPVSEEARHVAPRFPAQRQRGRAPRG